ncbi:MAG TPA: 3-hydroxyacyl-CoA dehydrogenase NAD-binding domain-containing protein, partial [Blastocatellia bacterium]
MIIENVAVIGAGTMGHGIAQVAAQAGFQVVLEDVSEDFVSRGLARIEDNLKKGV